ncbi:sigma-70 family RNA polymerase sigma factor [Paenibacillus polymyxa]|uniref:Sigma-70 family RNA polymerase sigma factor n=1 Tax=Paenibacillus polymyxa TaxID=1406 RepID=A0A8I1LRB7_PAEPO|nr:MULTISPECIES: sigma-70 family RNA polymerase sigma factor [Paenibacillus]KAF6575585.1 sigma-70 family RNA polymerase sigma factor [Paenibacillus sp. EKM206P]KAF6589217.1 sigma-70 family RNA polymerase sigma factor [Paenibacillus sp. EKM205P]MBM0634584.1 sigma-70 family RNA polymerase sigma factor [Paenibacillus polymyxa]
MGVYQLNKENASLTEQQFSDRLMGCKERMYRIAYSYVKNQQDALEIISEASYKAFLSYKKLESLDYIETWIARIVINCAIDHLRRKKKYTYIEDSQQSLTSADSNVSLEEKMDLYEALEVLKPEERSFIILKFFEGQRFKDIAEVLSLSENTVKTKFYRILNKLKLQLTEKEG